MRYVPTVEVKWSAEDEYVRNIMQFISAAGLAITEAKDSQKPRDFRRAWAVVDTLRTLCEAYAPAITHFTDAQSILGAATTKYNEGDLKAALVELNKAYLQILKGLQAVGLYGRTRERPKKLKEEAKEILEHLLEKDLEKVAENSADILPEAAPEEEEEEEVDF